MSTKKLEKVKIIKDDKNRLARKLTLPPSLPPTLWAFVFFFLLTLLWKTIPFGPPPLPFCLGKSRFINSSEQGAWGKLREKVRDGASLKAGFSSRSSSSSSSSSGVFFGEGASWSSSVHICFMTNEIPQALARNNGLFGWLEAVVAERGLWGELRLASNPCSCPGCHSLS